MTTTDQTITGGRELDAFLQTLAPKIEQNIMRSALNAGARVIRDEAKSLAPVGQPNANNVEKYGGYQGALRDAIRVSSRIRNGTVNVSVKVGGKGGKSRSADVFYAHMVEFGTAAHEIKPKTAGGLFFGGSVLQSVMHPGSQGQPFMRPAFDNKSGEALLAISAQIRKRLTREGINTQAPIPTEDDQ